MYSITGNFAGYMLTNAFNLQSMQTMPKDFKNKSILWCKVSVCLRNHYPSNL